MFKKEFTVPRVLNAINEDMDDLSVSKHFNMLLCMFISPLLFLSAITVVVLGIFLARPVADILIESIAYFTLGVLFEVLLHKQINAKLANHLISALYNIVLLFSVVRFYDYVGPAIWTFAFIQIVLSLAQNSMIMLVYTSVTMLISGIYISFFAMPENFAHGHYYTYVQFGLFALLFVISRAIYSINYSRFDTIKSQISELKAQIARRKKAEEESLHLALYDQLTGLPNRTLFTNRLNQEIEFSARNNQLIYILFLDIDLFKMVNDTLGHSSGDELLKQIGGRLAAIFRGSDPISRVSGDEFLIMVNDVKSEQYITKIADRILDQISAPYTIDNSQVSITCSIGIAKFPDDGTDVDSLVKHADLAMYQAKQEGKNRWVLYSANLEQQVNEEMQMIKALKLALENQEFVLHYQPQIDSAANQIIGFEALIRWEHPDLGLLGPGKFIPIAEKSGLIVPIGEWVLRTACRQNKKWQNNGTACVPMAVNLSSKQLNNGSLSYMVEKVLQDTGMEPEYLELEITETILIQETDNIKKELEQIKKLGVKIAIDDFGTGYSAIQYIKNFPIDRIKIPMDFIHGISYSIKDESIITVILALAENLGIDVVAEGVETENQFEFLKNRLCMNIQGFLFCRPMLPEGIEDYCKNTRDDKQ